MLLGMRKTKQYSCYIVWRVSAPLARLDINKDLYKTKHFENFRLQLMIYHWEHNFKKFGLQLMDLPLGTQLQKL